MSSAAPSAPRGIAIVTDSTSNLSGDLLLRHEITVAPLNVHFGPETFRDQIDITTEQFMSRLHRTTDPPTTSQPSAGVFEEIFRALAVDHDTIIAPLISSKLSGTIQSATIAAEAVSGLVRVEIVDSLNASMGLGLQVLRAARLARSGQTAGEIVRTLRAETQLHHLLFLVDSLDYIHRGGRIGRARTLLGTLLQLKPLLRVDEGLIVPYERTRTRAKAIEGLARFVQGLPRIEELTLLHSSNEDDLARIMADLSPLFPPERMTTAQFSPVIGAHVGPGAVGVCVFEGEATP
ncbi:MAG: DegV family protein [Thermomicrobiales bacterium]